VSGAVLATDAVSFRSMGCEIVVSGLNADAARRLFEERDARFSRFRADSELNRVNAHLEGVTLLSEEFAAMLDVALGAARATGGIVTPAVGTALRAAGYDRDFAELAGGRRDDPGEGVVTAPVPKLSALSLRGRMLVRAVPVELDLNGVVKGKTVDDALAAVGAGWVAAGGDLATLEPVAVGLPGGDVVTLSAGGLATSSVAGRRWRHGGEVQHHLIDPATGRPARTPWRDVTAVAGSCVAADVAAKAALLLGVEGPAWLESRGLPGRFVDRMGRVHVNASWYRSQLEPAAAGARP
jgi:FAD:protein FMN transferase